MVAMTQQLLGVGYVAHVARSFGLNIPKLELHAGGVADVVEARASRE